MERYLKKEKKVSFLIIFGIIFSVFVFLGLNTEKAQAAATGESCLADLNCDNLCDECVGPILSAVCTPIAGLGGSKCADATQPDGKWRICVGNTVETRSQVCSSSFLNHFCDITNPVDQTNCSGSTPLCVQTGSGPGDWGANCEAATVCDKAPSITVSPPSYAGSAGSRDFTITIKNIDDAGCAARTFYYWIDSLPGGWTGTWPDGSPGSVDRTALLAAGASSSSVITVNPGTAASGVYSFTVKADDDDNSVTSSKDVSFTITAGVLVVTANRANVTMGTTPGTTFTVKTFGGAAVSGANVALSGGSSGSCSTAADGTCSINPMGIITGDVTATATDPSTGNAGVLTIPAVAGGGCVANTCGGVGGIQWCPVAGGPWTNCNGGEICSGGACTGCDGFGAVCTSDAQCCSNNCVIGAVNRCGAVVACIPNACNGNQYCPGPGSPWTDCPIAGQVCGVGGACVGGGPGPACDSDGVCDPGETNTACPADNCPAGPGPGGNCSGPGMYPSPLMFGYCTIPELITAATKWILGLVSGIIILILIFGGITYVTSAGDDEKIKTAKNTILYAIIGLAIILLAYTMINEVKDILKIAG